LRSSPDEEAIFGVILEYGVEKAGREGGTVLFNWLQNVGSASDAVAR